MSDWLWELPAVCTPFQPVKTLKLHPVLGGAGAVDREVLHSFILCLLHSGEQKPRGFLILPGHQALHPGVPSWWTGLTLDNNRAARVGMALATHCHQSPQPRLGTHCCPPSPSLVPLLEEPLENVNRSFYVPGLCCLGDLDTALLGAPSAVGLSSEHYPGDRTSLPLACAFPESPQHDGWQPEQPQLQCNSCHLVSTLASSVVPAFSWQIREREICIAIKK